jgi:hypothetical protein
MNSLSKNCFLSLVVLSCLTACSEKAPENTAPKKAPESAAQAEEMRTLLKSADEAATSLAMAGRHDKQYYLDRFGELISKCKKDSDFDMHCFKSGLNGLLNE